MGDTPREAASVRNRRRFWLVLGLVLLCGTVAVITMWPHPVDQGSRGRIAELLDALHVLGVPAWFGYAQLEVLANVAIFAPLGLALGLLLPARRVWLAAVLLPLCSIAIELTQLWFLPARFATVSDVIANSVGAWIGIGIAALLRRLCARQRAVSAARSTPLP